MESQDFDRIVGESADGLLRTAYLIVGDLQEAEDLVQETLLKVARRWPKVRCMATRTCNGGPHGGAPGGGPGGG